MWGSTLVPHLIIHFKLQPCNHVGEEALSPPKPGETGLHYLGPPVVPLFPFLGEGSPTTIHYRKKTSGALLLPSLLL